MSYAIYSSLVNKNVIIIGGDNGIGAAIVESSAKRGARVMFLDITRAESEALTASLGECVHPSVFRHCDLRDIDALNTTFPGIEADTSPVEVLVSNAANDDRHQVGAVAQAYWNNRIEMSLHRQSFYAQAMLPSMKKLGHGVILNLGSILWHLAQTDPTIYMTAKAGTEDLMRDLARNLGRLDIHINYIVPGAVRVPQQMALWQSPENEAEPLGEQYPYERIEPGHVVRMALFLASNDAARYTAREYFVDAGWCGG